MKLKQIPPGFNMQALKKMYGEARVHDLLLQAVYFVKIENIFNHNVDAPWFEDESLCYLATEAELSLGTNESESFYVGAYQNNYITKKSSGETSVTFMETVNADIAKSFLACRRLAINKDGTVNEPKHYAFKLTVGFINPRSGNKTSLRKTWLVGALSCSTEASSAGRSEVVKHTVTFVKLRPLLFRF